MGDMECAAGRTPDLLAPAASVRRGQTDSAPKNAEEAPVRRFRIRKRNPERDRELSEPKAGRIHQVDDIA